MKKDRGVFQAFSMIGQFGINMLVPIFLCSFLGLFLDRKFGTSFIVIILFFVGAIAGGYNVFRMARNIYGHQSDLAAYGDKTADAGDIREDDEED